MVREHYPQILKLKFEILENVIFAIQYFNFNGFRFTSHQAVPLSPNRIYFIFDRSGWTSIISPFCL